MFERLNRPVVATDESVVSSIWAVPQSYDRACGVVLAHGAGNDMDNPFLSYVHEQMAERDLLSVKFNFPYKERGARAPDRAPVLEATWRAILHNVLNDAELSPRRLFLGGKSMGGRIASQVVAQGEECAGLIFLGYPLHPARQPEKLRVEHLHRIRVPMLFLQGTRDPLCDMALLEEILGALKAPVTLHPIEGGDHSFKVPKRSGRTETEIWEEIVHVITRWIDERD